MEKRVKTDFEAWEFLTTVVYSKNDKRSYGQFRIHTNKSGIRLYIQFEKREYTGYHKQYLPYKHRDGIFWVYPKYTFASSIYYETFVGPTLTETLNKHFETMPGNVEADGEVYIERMINELDSKFRWYTGTLEEFEKL